MSDLQEHFFIPILSRVAAHASSRNPSARKTISFFGDVHETGLCPLFLIRLALKLKSIARRFFVQYKSPQYIAISSNHRLFCRFLSFYF